VLCFRRTGDNDRRERRPGLAPFYDSDDRFTTALILNQQYNLMGAD